MEIILKKIVLMFFKKLDFSNIYPDESFDEENRINIMNWLCEVLIFLKSKLCLRKNLMNIFYKTIMIFDYYS